MILFLYSLGPQNSVTILFSCVSRLPFTHDLTEDSKQSKEDLHYQRSLLILIRLHSLKRLFKTSSTVYYDESGRNISSLTQQLPDYFTDLGGSSIGAKWARPLTEAFVNNTV
ncbi:hypothetical protein GEMRC1_005475 [Eukaryota sp. GEM-RC1]